MNNLVKHQLSLLLVGCLLAVLGSMSATARELPDFTILAEQNSPAVVNISSQHKPQARKRLPKGHSMPEVPEGSPI